MKKIIYMALILAAAVISTALGAASKAEDMKDLFFQKTKIPIYQKNKLQMIIFSDTGNRLGRVFKGSGVVLEIIRADADVDMIGDAWGSKPYALGTDLMNVLNFWRKRINYSEGVMITARGEVDQENNRASGNDPVFFRSPGMDLNGIGFEADFNRRTIRVNSDVNIVMRNTAASPERIFSGQKMPDAYQFTTATGDALLIDSGKKQIMLIGSVDVKDQETTLQSERLTIFLSDRDDTKKKKDKDKAVDAAKAELMPGADSVEGIRIILADGDVVLTDAGGQKIYSDHMLYDLDSGQVTINCDEGKVPRIVSKDGDELSGEKIRYLRDQQHAFIDGNCRGVGKDGSQKISSQHGFFDMVKNEGNLHGDVVLEDESMLLTGPRMDFYLSEDNAGASADGANRSLDRVVFPQSFAMREKDDGGMTMAADKGTYFCREQRMDLFGKVRVDNNSNRMDCNEMKIFLRRNAQTGKDEIDRIFCSGGRVRIQSVDPETGNVGGTIVSDTAEFFEEKNLAVFTGNVKLNDDDSKLDCDRLELYLSGENAKPTDRVTGVGSGKRLEKAVAIGRVHMVDPKSMLDCDRMTIEFSPAQEGEKKSSGGMMTSGSDKMRKIICEGNVKGSTSEVNESAGAMFGAIAQQGRGGRRFSADRLISDFDKNLTELHGHVIVRDDSSRLDCEEMYIYSKAQSAAPVAAVEEDPDADPFAIADSESYAPSRVALGEGSELEKIRCEKNVRITNRGENGVLTSAAGDHGLYVVKEKRFVITCDEPALCVIRAQGKRQKCEVVTYDLERELFSGRSRPGRGSYTEKDTEPIPDIN